MTSVREKIKYLQSLLSEIFCGCCSYILDPLFNSYVSCIWCFQPAGNILHITMLKSSFDSVHQVNVHSPIYHPIIKLFCVTAISSIPICSEWGSHFFI